MTLDFSETCRRCLTWVDTLKNEEKNGGPRTNFRDRAPSILHMGQVFCNNGQNEVLLSD